MKEIHFYHETGRITAIWEIQTASQEDALRWMILAPPSSGHKREAVQRLMEKHPEDVQKIRKQLQQEKLT